MSSLFPYSYNKPLAPLRPDKLAKYLRRSKFKAIRESTGTSESAIESSNFIEKGNNHCNVNVCSKSIKNAEDIREKNNNKDDHNASNNVRSNGIIYLDSFDINNNNQSAFNSRLSTKSTLYKKAYHEAKIFPKPSLSHIKIKQAVPQQSSKEPNIFVKPEKSISNKLEFKVNNSTMSTSPSFSDKKTPYNRPSWIIIDEKMNFSPPPTISLNERFANLPFNQKSKRKKRTRRTSVPSNTWITIKKTKKDKCKHRRRAPKIDDDDDDDQDQIPSIKLKDDSFSHSDNSSNGLNGNEANSSIHSEPSILEDLDMCTADLDDNLLVDCMLMNLSDMDMDFFLDLSDLSKLEESLMSV